MPEVFAAKIFTFNFCIAINLILGQERVKIIYNCFPFGVNNLSCIGQ